MGRMINEMYIEDDGPGLTEDPTRVPRGIGNGIMYGLLCWAVIIGLFFAARALLGLL